MSTPQATRFGSVARDWTFGRSATMVAPSGQLAVDSDGPSFPGNLGLSDWNALSATAKVDFLLRTTNDRQQLADALTYGLEHGYNDVVASVGLAERALFAPSSRAIVPSGQVAPVTTTATTPVTPPATAPASSGARPIVFVAVTAAAIIGVYAFRRAQHRQYRNNPALPYGNPLPSSGR